jgi:hypothetical protein
VIKRPPLNRTAQRANLRKQLQNGLKTNKCNDHVTPTPRLPSPATELQAAWGVTAVAQKIHKNFSNDLQPTEGIDNMKVCSEPLNMVKSYFMPSVDRNAGLTA